MEDIIVRYKWGNDKKSGDLVCSLTEFIDNYLLFLWQSFDKLLLLDRC